MGDDDQRDDQRQEAAEEAQESESAEPTPGKKKRKRTSQAFRRLVFAHLRDMGISIRQAAKLADLPTTTAYRCENLEAKAAADEREIDMNAVLSRQEAIALISTLLRDESTPAAYSAALCATLARLEGWDRPDPGADGEAEKARRESATEWIARVAKERHARGESCPVCGAFPANGHEPGGSSRIPLN